LLEKNNYSCSECGWNKINPKTGKSPLEIDHIDGDCSNNKEENLRVLCPNCHSLTPTWKALNKGNGNKESHRYSGLIK
jgi:5-methylcytosine-specific restriction endonuclease McrA